MKEQELYRKVPPGFTVKDAAEAVRRLVDKAGGEDPFPMPPAALQTNNEELRNAITDHLGIDRGGTVLGCGRWEPEKEKPSRGSEIRKCHSCGLPVVVSPSSLGVVRAGVIPVCTPCLLVALESAKNRPESTDES